MKIIITKYLNHNSPKYLDIKYEDNILNFSEDELNYILNSDNNNHNFIYIDMINGNRIHNANVKVELILEKNLMFLRINITTFNGIVIKKDYLCGGKGVIVQGVDFMINKQTIVFDEIINSHINKYDILD